MFQGVGIRIKIRFFLKEGKSAPSSCQSGHRQRLIVRHGHLNMDPCIGGNTTPD